MDLLSIAVAFSSLLFAVLLIKNWGKYSGHAASGGFLLLGIAALLSCLLAVSKFWVSVSQQELLPDIASISILVVVLILAVLGIARVTKGLEKTASEKTELQASLQGELSELDKAKSQVEEKLKAADRLDMQSQLPVLLCRLGKVVACNAAAVEFLRVESQEGLLGAPVEQFSAATQSEGESKELIKDWRRRLKESGDFSYRWVFQTADGTLRPQIVVMSTQLFEGDLVIKLQCATSADDIESELFKNLELQRFKTAIGVLGGACCEWSFDSGHLCYYSSAFPEIVDYPDEEIQGIKNFPEWLLERISPDKRADVKTRLNRLSRKGSDPFEMQFSLKSKKGVWSRVDMIIKSYQIEEEDRVFAYFTDTTYQYQNRHGGAKLFSLVENSCNPMMLLTGLSEIEYVNPAFVRATGFNLPDMEGVQLKDFLAGVGKPEENDLLLGSVRQGQLWAGDMELRLQGEAGKVNVISLPIEPVKTHLGLYYLVSFEKVKMEEPSRLVSL